MKALALAAVLLLAGCAASNAPSSSQSGTPTTTSSGATAPATTTAPAGAPQEVQVSGAIAPDGPGFRATVSAYNPGPQEYGVANSCYEVNWGAALSGPPGETLTYKDPRAPRPLCAVFLGGTFPPRTWLNWTETWDGRLWGEGGPSPAPPGEYAWRFTFSYYASPGHTDPEGHFTGPGEPRSASLAFRATIP